MSGFPPIQIFLLCVAFALLAIPLAQLTGDPVRQLKQTTLASAHSTAIASIPSIVRLRYAHKPLSVSLQQDGKPLWEHVDLTASPTEIRIAIHATNKRAEMILAATWPPGTPDTALTVELEPDGLDSRSETRWSSNAQLNEVVTFQW